MAECERSASDIAAILPADNDVGHPVRAAGGSAAAQVAIQRPRRPGAKGHTLRRMPEDILHDPLLHAHHGPAALPDGRDPQALEQWLDAAHAHCKRQGAQMTEQRREVLALLLLRGGSAKAYDLQDDMQQRHGRVAPTTVYRALDFLMEQRLVHKVDATNSYAVCSHLAHDHPSMMLVCIRCGDIGEWHDDPRFHALSAEVARLRPGFEMRGLEIKGICARCAQH